MKHLYLFTLEIVPLEVGETYDDLPSHLTLMSRFLSDVPHKELANHIQSPFMAASPVELNFGHTTKLGPKKVTVHMVTSPAEQKLHEDVRGILEKLYVVFQYPEFIGLNHKAHVTQKAAVDFPQNSQLISSAAYLIEVIGGRRVIRSKFTFGATGV